MQYLKIEGQTKLNGSIKISGAKNAALPLLASTILCKNEINIGNVPNVVDINTLLKLLGKLGSSYERYNNHIKINTSNINETKATYNIVALLPRPLVVTFQLKNCR